MYWRQNLQVFITYLCIIGTLNSGQDKPSPMLMDDCTYLNMVMSENATFSN